MFILITIIKKTQKSQLALKYYYCHGRGFDLSTLCYVGCHCPDS